MNNLPTEHEIGSLTEYQELIFELFGQWKNGLKDISPTLWFRGQSQDKPLLPSVLRKTKNLNTGINCNYNEFRIINTFLSLYKNYTSERFQEKTSEFYSFMQHYGVPTRLLDWTENAVFALYFAVYSGLYNENIDRVVWIMNPGGLNELTTDVNSSSPFVSNISLVQARMKMVGYIKNGKIIEEFRKDEPDFKSLDDKYLQHPVAFYPASSGNIRIATQKGCFTIHGTSQEPIELLLNADRTNKHLIKVKIKKESVAAIREQLHLSGVTDRSIFPDMFGLARELNGHNFMLS